MTTAIILAGGKSLRMGRHKAFEVIGGKPIIKRVIDRLRPIADELIIVSSQTSLELPFPTEAVIVPDLFPHYGPLAGIYTGLEASSSDKNIVVACDMPFINTELMRYMVDLCEGYDAVVPRLDDGMPEPLHSVYSKRCLDIIKKDIDSGQLKVYMFLRKLNVRFLELEESRKLDPHSLSFFNINKPSDIDIALSLADKEKTGNE